MAKQTGRGPEPLLDIRSTAEVLGVSEKTICRWITAGDLPAARLGAQWRIRPADLADFIRDRLAR